LPALEPVLEQRDRLAERAHPRGYERQLKTISEEHYPHETDLLRQVEGVGTLTALSFVLTLEEPHRFAPPLREEPLGRSVPGAGASHQPVGG
jgi:transposase